VLWLYASNAARFEQSVRDTLDRLRVRGRQDAKANVLQLLHDWLCDGRSRPWLVILDNVDDARVLRAEPSVREGASNGTTSGQQEKSLLEYLPQCDHGKILVTSRSRDAAKELVDWKDIVAVEPMETEQAVALLEQKLDRVYDVRDVVALARALDFMPLAMAQAAAYICQRAGRCTVQEYVEKLGQCDRSEASVLDVDEQDLRRDREAKNSIMLTWQVSFNHIREVRPSASDLLSLMSFFDRQAIPEALLRVRGSGQGEGREESSAVESKDHKRDGADARTSQSSERNAAVPFDTTEENEKDIVILRSYSLVSLTTDRTVFEMHRLVQVAMRSWLRAAKEFDRWASQFISNLEEAFPTSEFGNWATCQSLFPHATAALYVEATGRETNLQLAKLLLRSGGYASAVGVYIDAEKMEERSLEVRRKVLGAGHLDTLMSMGNLARTYWQQGRWEEAEKMQMKVVEKMEEVLGEGHPFTPGSMVNNPAWTYSEQGRLEELEKLEVQAIDKSKEVLGAEHPYTLTSMAIMASTYLQQGRWEEAEKLKVEVLQKRKEVLGEGHPDTLTSMGNLASTYRQRGRWEEAEKLGLEVLQKRKEVLGERHPYTLTSMAVLALTYSDQGRWKEAEKLEVEVLEKRKEVLGEGHPLTLTSMGNLALTLKAMGQPQSAISLISSCAKKWQARRSSSHLHTIAALSQRTHCLIDGTDYLISDDGSSHPSDSSAEARDEGKGEEEQEDEAAGGKKDKVATPVSVK